MRRFAVLATALALSTTGCGGVSTQQEVDIGAQGAQQIQQQLPMIDDPVVVSYINTVGDSIARLTSRADLDWHFAVVNSDVINAFALPGGYIYVNRGVIERADRLDELAGVMAHEIEHVVRRHSVKQMEQMQNANIGVALGCTLLRACESQATQAAINVGGSLVFAKFSRADEQQADEGGFNNLVRARINPEGMISFFQKLLAEEQSGGGGATGASAWFSDHPGTQDRIADLQRMWSQTDAAVRSYPTDSPNFQAVKARIRAMPPAPKPAKGQ